MQTSTCDVGQWKEYFDDLFNPKVASSADEEETEDSEVVLILTQANFTEVVRKLLSTSRKAGSDGSGICFGCLLAASSPVSPPNRRDTGEDLRHTGVTVSLS